MQFRGSVATGILISLAMVLIPSSAFSAQNITPGTTCKVLNQKVFYLKMSYTCTKSGKKLVWSNGVRVAASEATSKPTPKRVFYFGICLFGTYWFTFLQMATRKFNIPVNFTNDLPIRPETMRKIMVLSISGTAVLGLVLVLISLMNPWLALAGYSLFIVTNMNPVRTFNKGLPKIIARLERK